MCRINRPCLNKLFFYIILIVFLICSIYAVFTQKFDHDEFEHTHITWCIKQRMLLYKDFTEHHGPFYPMLNLLMWNMTGFSNDSIEVLFLFRLINLLALWAIIILTFFITKNIASKSTAHFATGLLMTSYTFLDKGIEIRPDQLMTLFLFFGFLFLLRFIKNRDLTNLVVASTGFLVAFFFNAKSFIFTFFFMAWGLLLFLKGNVNLKINKKNIIMGSMLLVLIMVMVIINHKVFFLYINIVWAVGISFIREFLSRRVVVPVEPFPFFYKNSLCEFVLWGLAVVFFVFCKNEKQKMLGVFIIGMVFFLVLSNRYSQWYLPVIPLFAIIIAMGGNVILSRIHGVPRVISMTCLLIILIYATLNTYIDFVGGPRNKEQLDFTKYINQEITSKETIYALWSDRGGYIFRPHACSWWQRKDFSAYSNYVSSDLIESNNAFIIRDIARYRPKGFIMSSPNEKIKTYLLNHYLSTKYDYFFIRKDPWIYSKVDILGPYGKEN